MRGGRWFGVVRVSEGMGGDGVSCESFLCVVKVSYVLERKNIQG